MMMPLKSLSAFFWWTSELKCKKWTLTKYFFQFLSSSSSSLSLSKEVAAYLSSNYMKIKILPFCLEVNIFPVEEKQAKIILNAVKGLDEGKAKWINERLCFRKMFPPNLMILKWLWGDGNTLQLLLLSVE